MTIPPALTRHLPLHKGGWERSTSSVSFSSRRSFWGQAGNVGVSLPPSQLCCDTSLVRGRLWENWHPRDCIILWKWSQSLRRLRATSLYTREALGTKASLADMVLRTGGQFLCLPEGRHLPLHKGGWGAEIGRIKERCDASLFLCVLFLFVCFISVCACFS